MARLHDLKLPPRWRSRRLNLDDGNWLDSINDPGPDAPGRNNNCVDTALATTDTYSGNPTAAAHRTPDTNPDGTPSDRGETNGLVVPSDRVRERGTGHALHARRRVLQSDAEPVQGHCGRR